MSGAERLSTGAERFAQTSVNVGDTLYMQYSTEHIFKSIEKITATEPQPHRTVLKYFALFKNVALCLESGETPSY